MSTLQDVLFGAYFLLVMIILGGTIFCVMVEYPNWFADIPASLETTRRFYKALHPGYFFQIFGPLLVGTGIAFVIAGWTIAEARNSVMISIAIMIAIELLTFTYIYPRLDILFGPAAASQTAEVLRTAASEFTVADRIRTLMDFVASGFACAALVKFLRYRFTG
jgi:hypothetical protein